jgi:hypothetical protein
MKDIGAVNYTPQQQPQKPQVQPQVQPRETVDVRRAERSVEKQSVTTARTPVVETHQMVTSHGSQESVVDSRGEHLYSRPASKMHEITEQIAQTLQYTNQAARVTTSVGVESRSLLDMRA